MSVGYAIFIVTRRKDKQMEEKICVFCMGLVNDYVCYECNDYKGLMTLKEAERYLGEDFPEEYREVSVF